MTAPRPVPSMTAAQVLTALRAHYLGTGALVTDEWSLLTEVGLPYVPVAGEDAGVPRWRQIDVLLVRNWAGKPNPYERVAIEVKVSRADFFRDTDAKRAPWLAAAHRFLYAVPAGLVTPAEVPAGCGLLEVLPAPNTSVALTHRDYGKQVRTAKAVRRRTVGPLPEDAWRQAARRASRAEEQVRRGDGTDAEQVATLVEQLRTTTQQLTAARERIGVETARRRDTERLVATVSAQVCARCAAPLRVTSGAGRVAQWAHQSPALDGRCRQAQLDAGQRWPDPPSPASLAD